MQQEQKNLEKKSSLAILRWLFTLIWQNKTTHRIFVFSFFCIIATSTLSLTVPFILKKFINGQAHDISTPSNILQLLLLSYAFSWIIYQICMQLNFTLLLQVSLEGIKTIHTKLYNHLLSLSLTFHTNRKTGNLTNSISRSEQAIESLSWIFFNSFIPIFFELIAITIIFYRNYCLFYSLIMGFTFLIYFLFTKHYMPRFNEHQETYNKLKNELSGTCVDRLLTIETIKYFNNQTYEQNHFNKLLDQSTNQGKQFGWTDFTLQSIQKCILGMGILSITWHSGNAVILGTQTIGDFILINSYLLQFAMHLNGFGYVFIYFKKAITNLGDVIDIFAIKPEIKDAPDAKELTKLTTSIQFENVSFQYEFNRKIIHNLSFSIPAGKITAIVGTTGAGKSTLTKLLFRLYDPTSGIIYWNDQNIAKTTQDSLHQAIGVVSQETNLFNETLQNNILYGNLMASEQELLQAIKQANLESFVAQLPDGLQTIVGERGIKLSGGEKQRVALARVLLKQPELYIFDEATSSLDSKTEQEILLNIATALQNKTMLIIAHRLSTIIHADTIIVLEQGAITEEGTHQQLLEKNGIYSGLWKAQEKLTSRSTIIE